MKTIKQKYRSKYGPLLSKKGIYCIINTVTSKRYIGSTSINFNHRFTGHLRNLTTNRHHSKYLQHAWNKYGEDTFKFILLKFHKDDNTVLEMEPI